MKYGLPILMLPCLDKIFRGLITSVREETADLSALYILLLSLCFLCGGVSSYYGCLGYVVSHNCCASWTICLLSLYTSRAEKGDYPSRMSEFVCQSNSCWLFIVSV